VSGAVPSDPIRDTTRLERSREPEPDLQTAPGTPAFTHAELPYNHDMTSDVRRAAEGLANDFRAIVANRLKAVVVFGPHAADDHGASKDDQVRTLVVVEAPGFGDLDACARRMAAWARRGLATPLVIASDEFARSLDAFPIEFGAILAHHHVVAGVSPFDGLSVRTDDLRRACEVQARSHLLHLREGYLETGGDPAAIHALVARSAAPLRALLVNVARIDGVPVTVPGALAAFAERTIGGGTALRDVLGMTSSQVSADAARLYPSYLDAVERLAAYVDRWSASA
jgi:hypothetical protein